MYAGITPGLTSLGTSSFIYFYTFHGLKRYMQGYMHTSTQNDLFLGIVAGVVNVLVTTPLWVVNSRLKVNIICINKITGFICVISRLKRKYLIQV